MSILVGVVLGALDRRFLRTLKPSIGVLIAGLLLTLGFSFLFTRSPQTPLPDGA